MRVYSWAEIVTWLREALGEDTPAVNRDLLLADHALRLADEAERAGRSQTEAIRHLIGTC